jgi:P-type Cu+ transporter
MRDTPSRTITLTVPGMGSDHCAGIVRKTLERLDGVGEIHTNIANHHVSVTLDDGGPDGDTLKAAVEGAGYDVAAVSGGAGKPQIRLTVPGMGSDHCAGIIRSTLERLEGVDSIDTNIASHRVSVIVAADGQALGLVAVADTLKEESVEAIRGMHELGLHVVMITGDNERAARAVADEVGIDEVQAGVLPEGKVEAIRALQAKHGNHVAMVGDGINDAAALKQANVGIAIGAGADVAIEAADVTLVRGELTAVVDAMLLSRATFGKIVQNLIWASAYNVAAIPIAAIGLLHPMIGVIAMTASSLSVIGNSLLLKRRFVREAPEGDTT